MSTRTSPEDSSPHLERLQQLAAEVVAVFRSELAKGALANYFAPSALTHSEHPHDRHNPRWIADEIAAQEQAVTRAEEAQLDLEVVKPVAGYTSLDRDEFLATATMLYKGIAAAEVLANANRRGRSFVRGRNELVAAMVEDRDAEQAAASWISAQRNAVAEPNVPVASRQSAVTISTVTGQSDLIKKLQAVNNGTELQMLVTELKTERARVVEKLRKADRDVVIQDAKDVAAVAWSHRTRVLGRWQTWAAAVDEAWALTRTSSEAQSFVRAFGIDPGDAEAFAVATLDHFDGSALAQLPAPTQGLRGGLSH